MKSLLDVPAPAKLNLFLHVTGRRPDGYHLLQSVFMLIDWHDTLSFEVRTDGVVSREDLTTPLPPTDLIVRAAQALQSVTGCRLGAHIAVNKQIPSQAGMGGGSSDAATCLLALNRLWKLGLPHSQMESIGLRLGADVPFFLRGTNAWVEGIGEKLTPLPLPASSFLVVKPSTGIDTPSIFQADDLKRDTKPAIIEDFAARPYDFGHNDLQPVAERLCPDIKKALRWLEEAGLHGKMTGSGSAVFAHLPSGKIGKAAPDHWLVRECGNLEIHPLQGWVSSDN